MKEITSNFEQISLHDTSIESIERDQGCVIISFEGAYISKDHPAAMGTPWHIESGRLILLGVSEESAVFWYGDRVSKPHPEPEFPIDEIMHASFNGEVFAFDGFLKSMPWYEWFVKATGFKLLPSKASQAGS